MTVKEYLALHNEDDIKSVGIYLAHAPANKSTDVVDTHVTPISIIKHLDKEIDHVHLCVFDDKDSTRFIRVCFYVKEN